MTLIIDEVALFYLFEYKGDENVKRRGEVQSDNCSDRR